MWRFAATLRKGGCEGPNLHLLHSTTSRSSTYIEPLSVLVAHVASQIACHIAILCSFGSLHVLCTVASDAIRRSCTSRTFGMMCTLLNKSIRFRGIGGQGR